MSGMELLTAIFSIVQGIVTNIMSHSGMAGGNVTELPSEIVDKIEAVGMLEAGGMVVKSVEVIERPTVLPGTIAQWLSVFANNYLSCLHPKEREAFSDEVMALCRPALLREDGKWFADFVRLRFYAVKP